MPSRLRGDHGTENIEVATFMDNFHGNLRRGSYIWGRCVSLIFFDFSIVNIAMVELIVFESL